MEGPKVSHSVRPYLSSVPIITVAQTYFDRRSHLPNGVKTKSWQDRMEQAKKAQAIKRLQQELKDEKQAEITRYAVPQRRRRISLIKFLPYHSRREITLQRKKAAEERQRLEEDKAKVHRYHPR